MKWELAITIPLILVTGLASFWVIMKFGNCRDLGITVAQCLANQ